MSHGEVKLYETIVITSYIDTVLDGPPLQPADPLQLARMHQWISVFTQYLYRPAIDIVLQRIVIPMQGGTPDEALIRKTFPKQKVRSMS